MYSSSSPRRRAGGLTIAVVLQALLLAALILGLAVDPRRRTQPGIASFDVAAEPPPPAVEPLRSAPDRPARAEGRAAPPNLRSKATDIEAPEPIVPIPVPPPPVRTAPVAGPGVERMSGATERAGPGTGAGGLGDGLGSGDSGTGDGGGGRGGGGGDYTAPVQRAGSLQGARLPREVADDGFEGVVSVRFVVETNGRANECEIMRSSGNRAIDVATCRHIERTFRFRPSLDPAGRPVPSYMVQDHEWIVEAIPAN